MLRLFKNTNIDFVGMRKKAFILSGILILAGIISLIINGGPKYGIDFTGGTLLEIDFTPVDKATPPIEIKNIREVLAQNGYSDAEIQEFGNPNHTLIKIKATDDTGRDEANVVALLKDNFPEYTDGKELNELKRRSEHVGAKIGEELRGKAFVAILISLLGIILYIWWRFELTYGFAAVLALFHDVLITVGLFSIFGKELNISIIGALLTVVGYSLNDTIVVFDRIREDLRVYRKEKFEVIINHSVNEVLSRTVVTSITTLVVVLALFFLGGEVIHDFAFALLCGVIVGTYSSVFIASPVLVAQRDLRAKKIEKKTGRKQK